MHQIRDLPPPWLGSGRQELLAHQFDPPGVADQTEGLLTGCLGRGDKPVLHRMGDQRDSIQGIGISGATDERSDTCIQRRKLARIRLHHHARQDHCLEWAVARQYIDVGKIFLPGLMIDER